MDQLDRAGGTQRGFMRAVERLCSREHEQRTQPLAAVEHAVAHRQAKAGGRIGGHPRIERGLHRVELVTRPGFEFSTLHAEVQGLSCPSSRTFTCCSTASSRARQKASSSAPRR